LAPRCIANRTLLTRAITMPLLPQHLADLHRSGLTDETIKADGYYSETDPGLIARMLNWDRPARTLGPCLVIPFRKLDDTRNWFCRVRPDHPITHKDEKDPAKYEQPVGVSPPAFFPAAALARTHAATLSAMGLVEGEKKSSASTQAGWPCIGLCGVWSWQKPRPKSGPRGDRELIDDLAQIPWDGRVVWIAFDTDEKRKPNVNHARAELARVLTDLGALVHFVDFPSGPRGPDGLPGKMGADDYIVAHGEEAFYHLVDLSTNGQSNPRPLEDYRRDLLQARMDSVDRHGVYLDTSPPGAGKSHADMPAMDKAGSSLTVLLTHANCKETEQLYLAYPLDAAAYPALTKETCSNLEEATDALNWGLSASAAVCPGCLYRNGCKYRQAMKDAETAVHRIATHQRVALSFNAITKGARYVDVHEDPAILLRPTAEIRDGLGVVARVAKRGKDTVRDLPDQTLRYFFGKMEDAAVWLQSELATATDTRPLDLPVSAGAPREVDVRLLNAIRSEGVHPNADCLRVCRAIAAGEIAELTVRVDKVFARGGAETTKRTVCAVWQTEIPNNATIWLSDATADREEIEAMLGRPVIDATPSGDLARQHPAVQIPTDIKKSTAPGQVARILQGVLAAHADAQQVGILIDKKHVPVIKGTSKRAVLDEVTRSRIARVEYYRSGLGRGSNHWTEDCDLLIVAGTPRVPPSVVKTRLIQAGNTAAAARDGEWGFDYWSGVDTSGQRNTVRTLGYADHDWSRAHQAVVRAELLQAVGRARSVCEHGIPVVVVTTEEMGLPLTMVDFDPLPPQAVEAIRATARLSQQFSKEVEKPANNGASQQFPK